MNVPENFQSKMAGKTDDELLAMFKRPDDWRPEALEAARTVLRRRGVDPSAIILVTAPTEAVEEPNVRPLVTFKQQADIGIPFGFMLQLLGRALIAHVEDAVHDAGLLFLGMVFGVFGFVLFIWGCAGYAMGKGYTRWLAALGLLSCVGLIFLVLLPDRRKEYDDHTS